MMAEDQRSWRSYFQIAAIHGNVPWFSVPTPGLCIRVGLPYTQWDGAGGTSAINPPEPPNDDAPFNGYCVHGSTLFPTWHRPYTAVYEVCRNFMVIRPKLRAFLNSK